MENEKFSESIAREPLEAYGQKKFTIEEYIEMERGSEQKHEYYQGEIFAMAGAGWDHNDVFTNVFGTVAPYLKGKTCRPYGSDLRLYIPQNTLFTYPDITIHCKPPIQLYENSFTEPTVLIEILSASTRSYDRGVKFKLYRDIPTFIEYIMVDSTKMQVEIARKDDQGEWRTEVFTQPDHELTIQTIGLAMKLHDVYEFCTFSR